MYLWLGLVSFSVGVVLLFNLGSLLNSPSTGVKILIECVIAIMIFGGVVLMFLNFNKTRGKGQKKPIK